MLEPYRCCEFCGTRFHLRDTAGLVAGIDAAIDAGLSELSYHQESVYHGLSCRECAEVRQTESQPSVFLAAESQIPHYAQ